MKTLKQIYPKTKQKRPLWSLSARTITHIILAVHMCPVDVNFIYVAQYGIY